MLDDDILEFVAAELKSGRVSTFSESLSYFAMLEKRFPVGFNRIAWEQVSQRRELEIFPIDKEETRAEEAAAKLASVRDTVRAWLLDAGAALHDEVVWIGDDTDVGLRMPVEALIELFPVLFCLPQHAYALPPDAAWCLNYVMEGELLWGKATRTG